LWKPQSVAQILNFPLIKSSGGMSRARGKRAAADDMEEAIEPPEDEMEEVVVPPEGGSRR